MPRSHIPMKVVRRLVAGASEEQIREAFDAALVAWEHLRDPFDLAVWTHIALCCILGESCEHSTVEIAEFCRMSVGKVQEVRTYLLGTSLVEKDVSSGHGRGRPRWRLTTKDLREGNQE